MKEITIDNVLKYRYFEIRSARRYDMPFIIDSVDIKITYTPLYVIEENDGENTQLIRAVVNQYAVDSNGKELMCINQPDTYTTVDMTLEYIDKLTPELIDDESEDNR